MWYIYCKLRPICFHWVVRQIVSDPKGWFAASKRMPVHMAVANPLRFQLGIRCILQPLSKKQHQLYTPATSNGHQHPPCPDVVFSRCFQSPAGSRHPPNPPSTQHGPVLVSFLPHLLLCLVILVLSFCWKFSQGLLCPAFRLGKTQALVWHWTPHRWHRWMCHFHRNMMEHDRTWWSTMGWIYRFWTWDDCVSQDQPKLSRAAGHDRLTICSKFLQAMPFQNLLIHKWLVGEPLTPRKTWMKIIGNCRREYMILYVNMKLWSIIPKQPPTCNIMYTVYYFLGNRREWQKHISHLGINSLISSHQPSMLCFSGERSSSLQ